MEIERSPIASTSKIVDMNPNSPLLTNTIANTVSSSISVILTDSFDTLTTGSFQLPMIHNQSATEMTPIYYRIPPPPLQCRPESSSKFPRIAIESTELVAQGANLKANEPIPTKPSSETCMIMKIKGYIMIIIVFLRHWFRKYSKVF